MLVYYFYKYSKNKKYTRLNWAYRTVYDWMIDKIDFTVVHVFTRRSFEFDQSYIVLCGWCKKITRSI